MPKVPNAVKWMDQTSENRTKTSGYQTLSDNQTVWEPNDFPKRQNPNVRISDVHCMYIVCISLDFLLKIEF